MAIELYPDQQEALAGVLEKYHAQPQGGQALVVAPCGFGKTILFASLVKALKGINILIVAHRGILLDQAREKLQMLDPTVIVGKVGDGCHEWGAPITVASIDTIGQEHHLKNLHKFGYQLVIVDECHRARADGYVALLKTLKDAFHLGVTATPDRLDGKSLEPLFGRPVFSMDIKQGVKLHRLCDVRAIAVQTETTLDDVKIKRNIDGEVDFNERQLAHAVDNPERNALVAHKYLELAKDRRSICFGVSVLHCQHLTEAFIEAGIPAAYLTGNTTKAERKQLYQRLAMGEIKILSSINVLSEGFDLPIVSCVIMTRPTQSRALFTQCIGRGMRLAPGKKDCLILDITDNTLRLRLTPQNFRNVIGKLNPDETLLQAMEREEDEKSERETTEKRALIRRLNERRDQDKQVDLFGLPEWQERPGGLFVMEVGLQKHRIALVPCKSSGWAQLYDVQARLAPNFSAGQKWMSAQPLDYAMQFAEKRARMLAESSKNIKLVDKTATWREQPMSESQEKFLKWKKIAITENMTKGEAADLIDTWKQDDAAKKQAKAERAAARAARNEVSA